MKTSSSCLEVCWSKIEPKIMKRTIKESLLMKHYILIPFLILSFSGWSQPSPQEGYPARIKVITEQLKTDSLNYKLIWERLDMKVNLMGGFGTYHDVFSLEMDSLEKRNKNELYFDEFNTDFIKIFDNVITEEKYDIVEEGDFYLNRIWFYYHMREIDKAIEDAIYLRDAASYSRYWQRGDYYNNWALYSLYNLYIIDNQYEKALNAIDTMLEKKRNKDPKVLYAGGGGFLGFQDKIRLFEHFNKNEELLPFLKKTCLTYFNWYFENINHKEEYYAKTSKENGLHFLKLIVNDMKKSNDDDYSKFNETYQQLRHQVNDNFETISPDLSDKKLKIIVLKLFE